MADLTTAQRLAAYRAELLEAGFDEGQIRDMVQAAAPLPDDLVIQADVDVDLGPGITAINLRDGDVLLAGAEVLASQRMGQYRNLLKAWGGGAMVVMPTPDRHTVVRPASEGGDQ